MDARLHKAAIKGDLDSLRGLLDLPEEHILDGVENPLHVAAQFGHVEFVKEILNQKPKYAHKLNSQGQSPLHLASGAGHVEVIRPLLEKDAGVCFLRDKRGRTPLHNAARKGRVEVLEKLVGVEPTAAWVQTDQGEPILHLCASNGQFEALKKLIELIPDANFVNMKDDDHNSILHLLAAEIQTKVIDFLLNYARPEINSLNVNKYTPLDALVKAAARRSGYKKCKKILCGAGGKRAKELSQALKTTHRKDTWEAHAIWLSETKSTLMVVAILIATVTYQAALNPPGGVWQDDYPPSPSPGDNQTEIDQWLDNYYLYIEPKMHFAGEAVMSSESPIEYLLFSLFNLISLLSSAGIILLLISGFNIKRRWLMWALMIAMWISIGSMGFSFGVCSYYLTNYDALAYVSLQNTPEVSTASVISIVAALVLIGPLVTAHSVRLLIRVYKKFNRRAGSGENRDGAPIQVSVDPSTPT